MITLPTESVPATQNITDYNFLIMGDPGIGKSSLLASIPNYLLVDPIFGMKGLPGLKVNLGSWQDHLDLPERLSKIPRGAYAGIGLDTLNISYDICSAYVSKILKISHPSEMAHGTGWTRVTTEYTKWLQSMTLLGYHIVATCHTTIMEVKLNTRTYNRWIPAFVGGSAQSAYANTLKLFDIKGLMCTELIASPPVRQTVTKEGGVKSTVDTRVDMTDLQFTEGRVIHFAPSNNWLAGDTSQMLPDKVVLGTDWREDWNLILKAWGSEGRGHTVLDEVVETTGQQVNPEQIKASGLVADQNGVRMEG
jgi:hypothetical protein